MEESQLPEENRNGDESLANLPPTPVNEDRSSLASNVVKGGLLIGAAGAGILLLMSGSMTSCRGATRSSKLQWEQRQLEMEQAAQEAQARLDQKS
jgi:hypothetical protein